MMVTASPSSSGEIPANLGPSARSAARLAAIQALYQMELSDHGADAVVREFLRHRLSDQVDDNLIANADPAFFGQIVRGVTSERDELDDMLAAVLSADLGVDRLETVLKVVLRAGVYELSNYMDVPVRVIISEYVDIADAYFGSKETGLVNAVLDRIGRALRIEELEDHSSGRAPTAR
jgi:transcription antitermination protein NusB